MGFRLRGGGKFNGKLGVLGFIAAYNKGRLDDLVARARVYAVQHGLEAVFSAMRLQGGYRVSFHPAAPDIIFNAQSGYFVMDAETASVGPGYHAFLVGLIDHFSQNHDWVWNFDNAVLHFGDETGYYSDRDFAALQATMGDLFKATCEWLLSDGYSLGTPYYLGLSLEFNLDADYFAATSLGFRDRSFFEAPAPEHFFPWWEEGVTAHTLRNMALCKMWLEPSWTPPEDDIERRELEICQYLIHRAIELGAEFADHEGVDDIHALLRDEPLSTSDDAARVGYRRQNVRQVTAPSWSVSSPAYYLEEDNPNTNVYSLYYGDRGIHLSSYIQEPELTELQWPGLEGQTGTEFIRFKTDLYWAVVFSYEEGEGENHIWVWQGLYQSLDRIARVSAVTSDAPDEAWAEKVLRSVQPDAYLNGRTPVRLDTLETDYTFSDDGPSDEYLRD